MKVQSKVLAAIFAVALPGVFVVPASASVGMTVALDVSQSEVDALVAKLTEELEGAETEAEAASIIADVTAGVDIAVVASALQQLANSGTFSGPVGTAVAAANTSAQLAASSSGQGGTGSTGSTTPTGPTVSPFSGSSGSGVPGGGGGSGYPEG